QPRWRHAGVAPACGETSRDRSAMPLMELGQEPPPCSAKENGRRDDRRPSNWQETAERIYDLAGTQAVFSLSKVKPGADFSASLFVSSVRYQSPSFISALTASSGTATSFWPAPRKPPTPMISPVTWPLSPMITSSTVPILSFAG